MNATVMAVDVAKTVFEVAFADGQGRIVDRRRLTRRTFAELLAMTPPLHIVMEACGTAHYWGRLAQRHGHTVSLLPAAYVRPYVRRNKTDRTDTEALIEAARSGQLPTVPVKRADQQAVVALHRIREQWMTTRTARLNAIRGLLQEQGLTVPAGAHKGLRAIPAILEDATSELPAYLRSALYRLYEEIRALEASVATLETALAAIAANDPVIGRLRDIPGIGLLSATALVGTVGQIHAFRGARKFASWLGLTPREHSSGGKRHLGRISKRGDRYLRYLLTHGARAVLRAAHRRADAQMPLLPLFHFALAVEARRGRNKATIAVANKLARIVWAVWHRDVPFAAAPVAA